MTTENTVAARDAVAERVRQLVAAMAPARPPRSTTSCG